MKFQAKCATVALHEEWKCPPGEKLTTKVRVATRAKLLQLAGKRVLRLPKFCLACIKKVTEIYPELEQKSRSTSSSVCLDDELWSSDEPQPSTSKEKIPSEVVSDEPQSSPRPNSSIHEIPSDVVSVDELQSSPRPSAPIHEILSDDVVEPPSKKRKVDLDALTCEERAQLAYALGLFESKSVKTSSLVASRQKDLDSLLSTDVQDCFSQCNKTVLAFLSGLKQSPLATYTGELWNPSHGNAYEICKTIESIHNLSALNLTLPVHFRESVLLYTLTGSKLALKLLGSGGAHASYQSVKSWLASLSSIPCEIPQEDIILAFDKKQVLQRRWQVKLSNEVKCNIVTIIVFFQISKDGRLQHEASLKPIEWSSEKLSDIERVKYVDQAKDVKETHYSHLHKYLYKEIQEVAQQQNRLNGNFKDEIDAKVETKNMAALYKKCYHCHFDQIQKSRHTCPMCKTNVMKTKMKSMGLDEHGNAEQPKTVKQPTRGCSVSVTHGSLSRHSLLYESQGEVICPYADYEDISTTREKPSVHVLEPVYVNPCSYDAVATVMRNLGRKAGIKKYGGEREWVIVVCDGVPFNLCRRIIKSTYVCSECDSSLNGRDACTRHRNEIHPGEEISFEPEFDWVVLQPGPGHIEMNMVKGLVELGWDVFWRTMAICFNFRSEVALNCAKKVTDHHKGWTLCRIARKSITQELLVPFVREQLKHAEPDLTPATFFKFVMKAQDPNYQFMCDYVFELLDSVFLYRCGVRCGDFSLMEAGRAKFAKVWFGRNHPLYRELEMADTLLLNRMPADVRELVQTYSALNLTGKPKTGEGAHFRLEEVNQKIQQWLPNGPSTKDWEIACSNFDKLDNFRKELFDQMNIVDPKLRGTKPAQNIDEEVCAFRIILRSQKYLLNPNVYRQHVSLEGAPLNPDFKNFCRISREKRARYFDCFMVYEETADILKAGPPSFKESPVFVTVKERDEYTNVENMTISHIKNLIGQNIQRISDEELREAIESTWMEIKSSRQSTKTTILDFFCELEQYLTDQDSLPDTVGASDDDDM